MEQVLAGPPIDRSERLVEQDQLGILHDQSGEEDALELPDRKRLDRPALESVETDGGERLAGRLAHRLVRSTGPANSPPMSEQYGIDNRDREPSFDLGMLRQIGNAPAAEIDPFDNSFCGPHLADDPFQKGTLSRSVGSDNGGQRATRQRPAQVMDRGVAFIGQGQVPEDDGAFGGDGHDSAHQIASHSNAAAVAALTNRSAMLCSSRPRWRKPRRGRTLSRAITLAAARSGRQDTARELRSPADRRQNLGLRRVGAGSRRFRRL